MDRAERRCRTERRRRTEVDEFEDQLGEYYGK